MASYNTEYWSNYCSTKNIPVDRLQRGSSVRGLALESTLWCRYCYGVSERGTLIEDNVPNWKRQKECAQQAKDHPLCWLEMEDIYGKVGRNELLQSRFTSILEALWSAGVTRVLEHYLDGQL